MDQKQPSASASANNINSINRAFEILKLFHDSWELGIQDISRLTGLNKTTVFRVVKSLEANRMLEQNPRTNKYHPGFAIVELAHSVYRNFDAKHIFLPYMYRLQQEFNEDCVLSVLSGTHAVCIERMQGDNPVNLHSRVGRALPVYGGSTARVLLSFLDRATLEQVYEGLDHAAGMRIPVTREVLESSMEFVRKNGYLSSCGVTDDGVYSVSIPIHANTGKVYSLGVCGVEDRMRHKGIETITKRLLEYGKEISERLACCDVIET